MVLVQVVIRRKKFLSSNLDIRTLVFRHLHMAKLRCPSWSGSNCLALATMDSIWSSSHRCKQRHKRPRYYKTPVTYYSNSIATQRLLIRSGDISVNPGPVHPRRPRGCESISSQGGRAPGDIVLQD